MEITKIKSSNLEKTLRLDAEYYRPYNLDLIKKLNSIENFYLKKVADVKDGLHQSIDYDVNSNILCLSATAPQINYIDISRLYFMSPIQHEKSKKTQLKLNDLVLSTVGTVGNCGLITDNILPANCDRHAGFIRAKKEFKYIGYICLFLCSKFGKFQTKRESTGNVQEALFIYKINDLVIPKLPDVRQKFFHEVSIQTNNDMIKVHKNFKKLDNEIMENFDYFKWKNKKRNNFYIDKFNSLLSKNRMDAEHHDPKYDELKSIIKKNNTIIKIEDVFYRYKSIEPGKNFYTEKGKNFVRISDLTAFEIDYENSIKIEENFFEKHRKIKIKKNDFLFSKDGSPGICHFVDYEPPDAIVSSGILVMRLKKNSNYNPYYLAAILNSEIIKQQMVRDSGGSILLHWTPDEIKNSYIPILDEKDQKNIGDKYKKYLKIRKDTLEKIKFHISKLETEIQREIGAKL